MSSIEHLRSITLELPPSCIEFWPLNPQYAVVGTYNLERSTESQGATIEEGAIEGSTVKQTQERNGSLILLRIEGDDVKIIHTLATPSAILDIHFAPTLHTPSIFGVATSTGSIRLYQLTTSDGQSLDDLHQIPANLKITFIRTCQFYPEDVLVTAFSWYPKGMSVGLSLSNGEIFLGSTTPDADVRSDVSQFELQGQHELEAWMLAFLPNGRGVYSGGDDSALRFWSLPNSEEIDPNGDFTLPSGWIDKKIHGAGVTAILPLSTNDSGEHLILTGSYDDHIRLVHVTLVGRRRVLAEMNLGGGVWRLKRLSPEPPATSSEGSQMIDDVLLLASCMHAGARILKLVCEGGEWRFEVLAKFEEHKSMNYGSDCQPDVNEKGQRTFITTSFYDRLLCLWRY